MDKQEVSKVEKYLRAKFGQGINLKMSKSSECVEVYLKDEFIATVYKDEDEGEVSYTFTMSILDVDIA